MSSSQWKYLKVDNLFHIFDYRLYFPAIGDPLILTGPNGYGKTTLLTILNALAHEDYIYFWNLPFRNIELGYADYIISIAKEFGQSGDEEGEDDALSDNQLVSFSFRPIDDEAAETTTALVLSKKILQNAISGVKGVQLDNIADLTEWQQNKLNEYFRIFPRIQSFRILLRQLKVVFVPAERLRNLNLKKSQSDDTLAMIRNLRLAVSRMERSANRNNSIEELLGISEEEVTPKEETIMRLSRRLKEDMTTARQSYNSLVATNNQQLIERMLSEEQPISYEEYTRKSAELMNRIDLLLQFGMIDKPVLPEYSSAKASQLKAYIEIAEENLRSYDDLTRQMQAFLDWLSRNEFRGKTINASPLEGLVATEHRHQTHIPLRRLSSGEKHEIILAYWLAFEVPDGALLLIDEPELSLHVGWQIKFIPALRRIAERKNLVSVVATHAPFIINEEWDKTVDLELLDREKDNSGL